MIAFNNKKYHGDLKVLGCGALVGERDSHHHFSGRTIFLSQKNPAKKFRIQKKSDLEILNPKKSGTKKFQRENFPA
jgi:hypothetical protein